MAVRPSWTGQLRISLVSVPVQLFSGSKSERNIPLHMIHEKTGKRVRNQLTVEGVGKIDRDEVVKGYEYKKDKYVTLTADELSEIRLSTNKTINIVEFCDVADIDLIYFDQPYYILPQGDVASDAYATFHHALSKMGKVAIGEVVLGGKEHLVAIRPYGKGMMLETLRYADEVREAHSYFDHLKEPKVQKDQLDLATTLIKQKSSAFKIKEFDDSYETALRELINRKLKKMPIKRDKEVEETGKVVSLMDALKKSIGQKSNTRSSSKSTSKTKSTVTKLKPNTKSKTTAKRAVAKKPAAKKTTAKKKRA